MSNNSDVLNFLEDVQNTVNIYNVRNALQLHKRLYRRL